MIIDDVAFKNNASIKPNKIYYILMIRFFYCHFKSEV